ncbi:putative holin-like toxin [Brevibacillus sp. WF146]|uniref:putative holin-like toxin n=1 Tax=Brevibacillus sp. WF146 TaxID=319501 RepID=UPI0039B444E2
MCPCYHLPCTIESAPQGWSTHPLQKGGEIVTVYEALSLMLAFSLLIVCGLSFHQKKQTALELVGSLAVYSLIL